MKNSTYLTNANFYDALLTFSKDQQVTEEELKILKKYVNKNSSILDIGCGTGRHFLPLFFDGYKIFGIDVHKSLIDVLRKKMKLLLSNNNNEVSRKIFFNKNFLTTNFKSTKFDFIYSFWNTFNESCLLNKQGDCFFRKVFNILNENGKFLLNIDNPKNFDYKNLSYSFNFFYSNLNYFFESKVIKFYKKKNITKTLEKIFIIDVNGNKILKSSCYIYQRWWEEEEIINIADRNKLFFEKQEKNIYNNELYFIFSKKNIV